MADFDLREVVAILIEDEPLVEDFRKFCDSLDIPSESLSRWQTLYKNGTFNTYELFTKILTTWISKSCNPTVEKLREILESKDFNLPAANLAKSFQELQVTLPKKPESTTVEFGVEICIPRFYGRTQDLRNISDIPGSPLQQLILITGLPGIGKTELVKRYVTQYLSYAEQYHKYLAVSWFPGELSQFRYMVNKFSSTIIEGYLPLEIPEILSAVHKNLKERNPNFTWIVVIDNVESIHEDLKAALTKLPCLETTSTIVISSCCNPIVLNPVSVHRPLEGLKVNASAKFVCNELHLEISNPMVPSVTRLCEIVENHPLAIQQLICHIKGRRGVSSKGAHYTVQDYLEELSKNEFDNLWQPLKEPLEMSIKPDNSSIRVLQRGINEMITKGDNNIGRTSYHVLEILGLLDPAGIGIEEDLSTFCQISPDLKDVSMSYVEKCLEFLKSYSLIDMADKVVKIHPVVQLTMRAEMRQRNHEVLDENGQVVQNTEGLSREEFLLKQIWRDFGGFYFDPRGRYNRGNVAHLQHLWKITKQSKDLVKEFSQIPAKIFDLSYQLFLGVNDNNRRFVGENNLLCEILGADDVGSLDWEFVQGRFKYYDGNDKEALDILRKVVEKKREKLGLNHISTLRSICEFSKFCNSVSSYVAEFGENCLELGKERELPGI